MKATESNEEFLENSDQELTEFIKEWGNELAEAEEVINYHKNKLNIETTPESMFEKV